MRDGYWMDTDFGGIVDTWDVTDGWDYVDGIGGQVNPRI